MKTITLLNNNTISIAALNKSIIKENAYNTFNDRIERSLGVKREHHGLIMSLFMIGGLK